MITSKFGDSISWENHVIEILNSGKPIHHSLQFNPEKINRIKKHKLSGKLLDCGCHIGRWIDVFTISGYDYTGVDQSEYALKIARIYRPKGKFIHSFLWDISFSNEFDIAHTNAVLQHNTLNEQEKIIPKIYEALKSDGILIISESTVKKQTKTQRTYEGWIEIMKSNNFKFIESWEPNNININESYIFKKI